MQRSRPSVLHFRTGVRIPPPPDFARRNLPCFVLAGQRLHEVCHAEAASAASVCEGGRPARFARFAVAHPTSSTRRLRAKGLRADNLSPLKLLSTARGDLRLHSRKPHRIFSTLHGIVARRAQTPRFSQRRRIESHFQIPTMAAARHDDIRGRNRAPTNASVILKAVRAGRLRSATFAEAPDACAPQICANQPIIKLSTDVVR